MSTSMKRPPLSSETGVCGVFRVPSVPLSAVHGECSRARARCRHPIHADQGERGSPVHEGSRRLWLCSGTRTATRSTDALTHPSNLRETGVSRNQSRCSVPQTGAAASVA